MTSFNETGSVKPQLLSNEELALIKAKVGHLRQEFPQ